MRVDTELQSSLGEIEDQEPEFNSRWYRGWEMDRVLAYSVVGAALVFLLWQFHPSLIFSNTTTAGGDTGAHFSVAYFYIHNILDHFRLTGWSSSWYDGYPLYVFYFPLPGVITGFLGLFVPYGVAFKLTTVVGSFALPVAIYYFARSLKMGYLLSAVAAVMSVAYLFDRTYTIDGGNIASTLAGEYSFSISLALAFFALAVLLGDPAKFRRRILAGALLAATLLAHILPAAFAVAVLVFLVVTRRNRATVMGSTIAVSVMVLLSAIWEVPLISTYAYSTSMGWSRISTYVDSLAPSSLRIYLVLAAIGFVASIVMKIEFGSLFGIVGLTSAIAFIVFPLKAVYNGRMLPFYVLSVYMLAGIGIFVIIQAIPALVGSTRLLFEGLGPPEFHADYIAELLGWQRGDAIVPQPKSDMEAKSLTRLRTGVETLRQRLVRRQRVAFVAATVAMFAIVGVPLVTLPSWSPIRGGTSFVPSWLRWNYTGYEAKVGFPAYRALIVEMKQVGSQYGCGRAMWEYNSNQNDYGTPMALMLLPYWTNNCIGSMEGLFFESSATTPYHFLNQSELSAGPSQAMAGLPYAGENVPLGIKHLQLLGVRYYMAFTPALKAAASADQNLSLIGTVGAQSPSSTVGVLAESWNIYLVHSSAEVVPLTRQPVVMAGLAPAQTTWLGPALKYYQTPAEYAVARLMSGPPAYRRVAPQQNVLSSVREPKVTVTNAVVGNSAISFDVSRVGVPILVKVSYFPNWHASGATGPYRAAPNLMVVVPTSKHVELRYGRTTADWLGIAISAATVLFLGALFFKRRIGSARRAHSVEIVLNPGADESEIAAGP